MDEKNINELLELLNLSENLLRFNSIIEKDIRQHGANVVYSYNNIIIATEVDDNLFAELKKNPFIEFIEDLPMKRYGDIDMTLIDQLDISKLSNVRNSNGIIPTLGGDSNLSGNTTNPTVNVDSPIITNTFFTLTSITNQWFEYDVIATGTQPISFSITPQIPGPINIYGNKIKGFCGIDGKFPIVINATNSYGTDTKTLLVESFGIPKITSTLKVIIIEGAPFEYIIENTGSTYTYRATNLPSGLTLTDNIISGIINVPGTYNTKIFIDDSLTNTGSTAELKIIVGTENSNEPPIITSSGTKLWDIDTEGFEYIITSEPSQGVIYNITGTLPDGLNFFNNKIIGTPTESGKFNIKLYATNYNGQREKQLVITISSPNGLPFN